MIAPHPSLQTCQRHIVHRVLVVMPRLRLQQAADLHLLLRWCSGLRGASGCDQGRAACETVAARCYQGHKAAAGAHSTALLPLGHVLMGAGLVLASSQAACCDPSSEATQDSSAVSNEHTAKFSIFCDKARRCAAEVCSMVSAVSHLHGSPLAARYGASAPGHR